MLKIKGIILKFLQWYFCIFCFTSLIAYGFNLGSILMTVVGIAAMPLKQIRDIWSKVLKEKAQPKVKVGILAVAFVISCCIMPQLEEKSEPANTQIVYDTEATETEESEAAFIDTEMDVVETEGEAETEGDSQTVAQNDSPAVYSLKKEEYLEKEISQINIPEYSGKAYVALNNNYPTFPTDDLSAISYEYYSELDSLGRCGVVFACIGQDIMPTEERGSIGSVKPTGWHTVKYDIVDGKYLYNRCHLIGYQLTGENANTKNLITGTRQMNVEGMLPLENMIADYVKETGNHVMYKVTPVFEGNNLLAKGVQMEAYSIEDNGAGICFNVFAYNVQEGIDIDYASGESSLCTKQESQEVVQTPTPDVAPVPTPAPAPTPTPTPEQEQQNPVTAGSYAVNNKNGKIHAVGECSATGTSSNAMTDAVYFNTYEEALAYSMMIAPNLVDRNCKNCW